MNNKYEEISKATMGFPDKKPCEVVAGKSVELSNNVLAATEFK